MKIKIQILLMILVLPSVIPATAQVAVDSLAVLVENNNAVVRVNNFPLLAMPEDGNQGVSDALLSPFLRRGSNEVSVTLTPMLNGEGGRVSDRLFSLRISRQADMDTEERVVRTEVEQTVNEGTEEPNHRTRFLAAGEEEIHSLRSRGNGKMHHIRFDSVTSAIETQLSADSSGTVTIRTEGTGAHLPVALPWDGAKPVLDDSDRTTLRALATSLHTAFVAKDFNGIILMMDAKYNRMATAMGVLKSELAATEIQILKTLTAAASFQFAPLDAGQLVFETFDGINLVRIKLPDGAAIRGEDASTSFETELYASKLDGIWVLVE